jgi:hypothetical protein
MAVSTRILKSLGKKAWTRFLDRFGGRLVSGMADTSADAPSAGYAPKRDLYRKMQEQRMAVGGEDDGDGHDHGH